MKRQVKFLTIFAAGILAVPAFAADGVSGITGVRWGKNTFYFEPTPSGPQPLRNLIRRPNGTGNVNQLVGDYRNPILKSEAAAVVKQKGELAIAGKGFVNAQEQCRPIQPLTPSRCSSASRCCRRTTETSQSSTVTTTASARSA